MRISTEQLRQAFQAAGSRQQKNGSDGQGTEFQDVIAQILAMMNTPLNGQPQQIQGALSLAAGSINQEAIPIQGSAAYRFLAQQSNLQFLYSALMGANASDTMLQAAITSLALELAKQNEAGISNGLVGESAFLQENLSQAMNNGFFTANALQSDALDKGTISETAVETMPEAGITALPEFAEQAAALEQENIDQSMEHIQSRQIQSNPVQQGMPFAGSQFSDAMENAYDEHETGQIQREQFQSKQFNSEQIQSKQLQRNHTSDSPPYNDHVALDANEPEAERRIDAHAFQTQTLPFVRNPEATEISRKPVRIRNLQDIVNQVTEEVTLLKEGNHSSLKVKLKPEELGEIEIFLSMKGGHLSGEILVESITTREAIESQLQSLKDRLRSQNIMLSEVSIGLQQFSQEQSRERRSSYQNGSLARQFSGQADRHDENSGRQTYSQSLRNTYRFGSIGRTLDMLA